jgi:hypothetical protein
MKENYNWDLVYEITVRPLEVTITTKDTNLLAEKRYDVECISGGARPLATISWWKNSRQISLKKSPITVSCTSIKSN